MRCRLGLSVRPTIQSSSQGKSDIRDLKFGDWFNQSPWNTRARGITLRFCSRGFGQSLVEEKGRQSTNRDRIVYTRPSAECSSWNSESRARISHFRSHNAQARLFVTSTSRMTDQCFLAATSRNEGCMICISTALSGQHRRDERNDLYLDGFKPST
jgi:hypothetical protein